MKTKMKPQVAILLTLVIFIAGIVLTSATGLWQTKSDKTPNKLADIEDGQSYDPADIRGSFTFGEISELYGVPLSELALAFGVDEKEAADFQCKNLETLNEDPLYEVGTGSMRLFVAYYLGLPYEATEATYLSEVAIQIIQENGTPTEAQLADLENHVIPAA